MRIQVMCRGLALGLVLLAALGSPARAEKVTPVTTLISTASTGDSAVLDTEFLNSVTFTTTMSSTGTVVFKGSGNNGTSYAEIACFASDDTSGTPVTSTNATSVHTCNIAAMQKVKVTVSANGGTIVVEAQASSAVAKLKGGGGGGGGGAPTTAGYWVDQANGGLSAERNLGGLTTGLVLNTVTAGVGVPSAYAGTSCTNQVLRLLSAAGAGTCITITSAYVDSSIGLTGSALSQFAATTSAQLAGVLSDEAGSSGGFVRTVGASIAPGTLNLPNSTSLPGTCAVGDVYMDTDATSGQRLYACESTNTWALQGDGGAGGGLTHPQVMARAAMAY